jgi:isopenicillin-N N-acyltransferase-like protein
MKIVEVSGNAHDIGCCTGEALREEIRLHLEMFPLSPDRKNWERRLPSFIAALKRYLPDVLAEIEGMAEGANIPLDDILRLNIPMYANELDLEGCTNIAFADGSDGPIWGKNNDGLSAEKRRPACGRLVRRNNGIPLLIFTFCGMVATTDGMNAEGVAVGHSSVGSVFQQSDHFVPIRLWAYEAMIHSHTTAEFVQRMASLPTRGKGYSILCLDRNGVMCSIEAPCPMMQIRKPENGQRHMNCVNYYQLPHLANADRRSESGKQNAIARRRLLEQKLSEEDDFSLEGMKKILRYHGDPSICRHGDNDGSYTEYSMIGLPQGGRVLFLSGNPCENEFAEVKI